MKTHVHNGKVTVNVTDSSYLDVNYDPDLKMTRLRARVGDSTTEVWLPAVQLSDLLSQALSAAASDPGAIGYDSYHARTNDRLAHIVGVGK